MIEISEGVHSSIIKFHQWTVEEAPVARHCSSLIYILRHTQCKHAHTHTHAHTCGHTHSCGPAFQYVTSKTAGSVLWKRKHAVFEYACKDGMISHHTGCQSEKRAITTITVTTLATRTGSICKVESPVLHTCGTHL